jgi:hypothetical protein
MDDLPDWAYLLIGGGLVWWYLHHRSQQPQPQQQAAPAPFRFSAEQPCPPGTFQQFYRDGSGFSCRPIAPGTDELAAHMFPPKKDLPS